MEEEPEPEPSPPPPPPLAELALSLRGAAPRAHLANRPLHLVHVSVSDRAPDSVSVSLRPDRFLGSLPSQEGFSWSETAQTLLFAATEEGESVCLRVGGFRPSLLYIVNPSTTRPLHPGGSAPSGLHKET